MKTGCWMQTCRRQASKSHTLLAAPFSTGLTVLPVSHSNSVLPFRQVLGQIYPILGRSSADETSSQTPPRRQSGSIGFGCSETARLVEGYDVPETETLHCHDAKTGCQRPGKS